MNRICPACGSKNIAKIQYGYPMMSEKLRRELDDGKVKLGGCIIMEGAPNYYCNDCEIEFDSDISFALEHATKVYYRCGAWDSSIDYTFTPNSYGFVELNGLVLPNFDFDEDDILWSKFIMDILSCHVLDWQDDYIDSNILDGVQWVIRIHLSNNEVIEKGGSNAYPPHWKKFKSLMNRFN